MSSGATAVAVLSPFVGIAGTLGGAWLNQHFNERHRDREGKTAERNRAEKLAHELFEAVSELHLALRTYVPQHNAWQPKLMLLGVAFLEYSAGKASGGYANGTAQAGRLIFDTYQREMAAAVGIQVPLQRVLAASAQATTFPDEKVRTAALELGRVAADAGTAYGLDNLWRGKQAAAARQDADALLYAALGEMVTVVNDYLRPKPEVRKASRWRRTRRPSRFTKRRSRQKSVEPPLAPAGRINQGG